MKTWNAKPGELEGKWWLVDATDKTVGRIATEIAMVIRGKNKPTFTPHVDTGDFVVVINAEKVKFSGDKWLTQTYYRHSRFFGSLKQLSAQQLLEKDPTKIMTDAVWGMLPKNKLSRRIINKLKVYSGPNHPHEAQRPQAMSV